MWWIPAVLLAICIVLGIICVARVKKVSKVCGELFVDIRDPEKGGGVYLDLFEQDPKTFTDGERISLRVVVVDRK